MVCALRPRLKEILPKRTWSQLSVASDGLVLVVDLTKLLVFHRSEVQERTATRWIFDGPPSRALNSIWPWRLSTGSLNPLFLVLDAAFSSAPLQLHTPFPAALSLWFASPSSKRQRVPAKLTRYASSRRPSLRSADHVTGGHVQIWLC